MARAVTRTWYRIALARPDGAPVLVAAQGEHLGEAVAAAEKSAPKSQAVAAELPASGPIGDSVGKQHVIALPDPVGELPAFRFPRGVLPQLGVAGELRAAARGYVVHADPALRVIEAMTDREHLVDLFLGMVERLPAGDNLEVRLLDHFEGGPGTTDVWLTSRVTAKKILRFLDDHDRELIDNGHVELSIYVRAHRATLRLTEHKTVVWIADPPAPGVVDLEPEVLRWLAELGVPRAGELTLVTRVPHFHYRPGSTRDRNALGDQLFRQRLRRVATLARPAG